MAELGGNALGAPLKNIKGVGPKLSELFSKKGIDTFEDALYFIPRAYEDRRKLTKIADLKPGQAATVMARVVKVAQTRNGRQSRFTAYLTDDTGEVALTWFMGGAYLNEEFTVGRVFLAYGESKFFAGRPTITHPEYERVEMSPSGRPMASANFGRIIPLYSETEGLHQKTIRKVVAEVVRQSVSALQDPLPEELRGRLGLPKLRDSFVAVHFPNELPDESGLTPSLKRIIFEEFFVLQLGLGLKKQKHNSAKSVSLTAPPESLMQFRAALGFVLTGDQEKAIAQLERDLAKPHAMARLVQGDVGSGKTVVALAGALIAARAGYQTAFMVPTEILALQHLKSAKRWLEPLGVRVELLVQSAGNRKEIEAKIAAGECDLVVGTQALFQSGIQFGKLGFVIVDEQHRFGVDQRGDLVRKAMGHTPHLLMMTATPIPRTLALTLYGDLDLTLIREKPVGRKKVFTRILRERDRPQLYSRIRQTLARGEQVYIIYPLVEASEKLDLKSATEMHARLKNEVFPDVPVALLHGRMKGEEKEQILRDFIAGQSRILVSTTVIEVGIDVANATLMVIEHPERLGLSQLHQLRGRVGRGSSASECILMAGDFVGPRLRVMEGSEDGFEIAEEDLKIRGPGEFLGTRQSGLPGFRVGQVLRDAELLVLAREEALRILEQDRHLGAAEHAGLRQMVESRWKEKIERLRGG